MKEFCAEPDMADKKPPTKKMSKKPMKNKEFGKGGKMTAGRF